MSWIEFVEGFAMMVIRSETAISFWSLKGIPLWESFLISTLWTSFTLFLIYKNSSWLAGKLKQWHILKRKMIRKKKTENKNNAVHQNLVGWLTPQKKWVILGLGFVPIVPILPTAVIVTVGALNIRYGLEILLLGNTVRRIVMCYLIHQGIQYWFL